MRSARLRFHFSALERCPMKFPRITAAFGLAALFGCADIPTRADVAIEPAFSGFGFGSGHRTESDTTDAASAATQDGTAADGDESEDSKSGFGFGSGH
jgi:hypothetical protein